MLELKEVYGDKLENPIPILEHKGLQIREVKRSSLEGMYIMKQIYDLRYEVYTSLGWITNSKEKAKMIKDEFDEVPYTTHFAIIEGNKVIGAVRNTKYSEELKLPCIRSGIDPRIFGYSKIDSSSEVSRYLMRQDRKYPGGAKQLLFNSLNYELSHNTNLIVSIGNPEHLSFFNYIGYVTVNKPIEFLLDQNSGKKILVKGIPLVIDKLTLNKNMDFDKYESKRVLVRIT